MPHKCHGNLLNRGEDLKTVWNVLFATELTVWRSTVTEGPCRDLQGDGDHRNSTESTGILQGWKLVSWDFHGMKRKFCGIAAEM